MEYKKYTQTCVKEDCSELYYAKDLCKRHYKMLLGKAGGYAKEYALRKADPAFKEKKRLTGLAYRARLKEEGVYTIRNREYRKKYLADPLNKEKDLEKGRRYYSRIRNKPEYRARQSMYQKSSRFKFKMEAFTKYSTNGEIKCATCGFTDIRALTLDHIRNDGLNHKKTINARSPRQVTGTLVYRDLKKKGWPVGYQILCYNCNWIKYMDFIGYGIPIV